MFLKYTSIFIFQDIRSLGYLHFFFPNSGFKSPLHQNCLNTDQAIEASIAGIQPLHFSSCSKQGM